MIWDMWNNKVSIFDDRSFNEFKQDILKGTKKEELPSKEQLIATVEMSKEICNGFEINQEGG